MVNDEISSGNNSPKEKIDSLLEAAATEARRISSSIQALAGTASCKGVQIHGLNKWVILNNTFTYTRPFPKIGPIKMHLA